MNQARLVFGGMFAMAAVFGFGRFVFTPILPHMIADGLTPRNAGLLAAANYVGYLAGALAGTFGLMRRRVWAWYVGSVGLSGVTLLAMAFTNDMSLFLVLRFLNGIGGAVVIVTSATLIFAPLFHARRQWYGMAPFMGVGLGIAASSALVALLGFEAAPWQTMWLAAGVAGCVLTLLVALLVPRGAPANERASEDAVRDGVITWSRRLVLLTLSYGLFGFGYVITATFVVVITRETPTLNPLEPYVWSIVGLSGAASIPFWSLVARKAGDVACYAIMMVAEAVGVALSVLVPSPPAIVAAAVLLGGTIMAITAIGLQIGRQLAVGAPQKIAALMTAVFGLGQVVGPLVAGHLREVTGSFLAASLAAAAALAIGAALALVP